MLTLLDCEDYCDLSKDEILTFAKHEHVPEIIAAEMAANLVQSSEGISKMRQFIKEELHEARLNCDTEEIERLETVLDQFDDKFGRLN